MPRMARVVLPGLPHHLIQRGHNRQSVFVTDADFHYYLGTLTEWKTRLECSVYAYCLMTNHVHLVVAPGSNPRTVAQLMKRLAGRQTRYVNRLEGRSGTLWEGRYKSSPIDTDTYLLACCRYVELNPVRAGLVVDPADYPWSSYRGKIGLSTSLIPDHDPCYDALGVTAEERVIRYTSWVKSAIPSGEWEEIRRAVQRGQLTGGGRFADEVAQRIGQRVSARRPGRPPNAEAASQIGRQK
jgi:putative transposase